MGSGGVGTPGAGVDAMTFMIRPAIRSELGLWLGLAGGTGSGKTWSAMEIAKGIVGPGNRFAVIDTENKRASHYADMFEFDVVDFQPPFSSARYEEAVKFVYGKGYRAIVVDSFTHEHDGEGGYLDTQSEKLAEMVKRALQKDSSKSEWQLAEKLTPLSWKEPKGERRRMLQSLLACSSTVPIIFCLRAEEKYFMSKEGKLMARSKPEWEPLCGKGMMFEMTASFMLYSDRPGIPNPIKLQEQHKKLFPLDRPLGAESGRLIAEWAKGKPKEELKETPKGKAWQPILDEIQKFSTIDGLRKWTSANMKAWKIDYPKGYNDILKAATDKAETLTPKEPTEEEANRQAEQKGMFREDTCLR